MAKDKKTKEELEKEKQEKLELKEKEKAEKKKNKEEQKSLKKEERKEKNAENFKEIKKAFNMYAFVVKVVAAIILLAFAILILVNQKDAKFIMFIVTAGVALIVAIIRCIANLAKKEKSPQIKKVIYVVSLIHALISLYLIIAAVIMKNEDNTSDFTKFNQNYFPIFLAVLLYSESVGYFMNTVLFKAESRKFMFWLHIVFISLAVVILSLRDLNSDKIVIALAIIAIACALFIGGEAVIGYFNYKNGKKAEESDKKDDSKEDNNTLEAPTNRQDEPLVDPNVIDKDSNNDSAIIQ